MKWQLYKESSEFNVGDEVYILKNVPPNCSDKATITNIQPNGKVECEVWSYTKGTKLKIEVEPEDLKFIKAAPPKREIPTIEKIISLLKSDKALKKYKDFYSSDFRETNKNGANVYFCVSAGNVYECGRGGGRSLKQRLEDGKKDANEVIDIINSILIKSDDKSISSMTAEIVNDDFHLVRTHADSGDDGDEYFGVQLYIKIS